MQFIGTAEVDFKVLAQKNLIGSSSIESTQTSRHCSVETALAGIRSGVFGEPLILSQPLARWTATIEKEQKMMNQSEIVCSGEIEKRRIQGLSFWSAGVETIFGHSKGSRAICSFGA